MNKQALVEKFAALINDNEEESDLPNDIAWKLYVAAVRQRFVEHCRFSQIETIEAFVKINENVRLLDYKTINRGFKAACKINNLTNTMWLREKYITMCECSDELFTYSLEHCSSNLDITFFLYNMRSQYDKPKLDIHKYRDDARILSTLVYLSGGKLTLYDETVPLDKITHPIISLEMEWDYTKPLVDLPATITYLKLGREYGHPIDFSQLPNLKYLRLGAMYDQDVDLSPCTQLQTMKVKDCYDGKIIKPPSLHTIFGNRKGQYCIWSKS
jgi:hypothetical protein